MVSVSTRQNDSNRCVTLVDVRLFGFLVVFKASQPLLVDWILKHDLSSITYLIYEDH